VANATDCFEQEDRKNHGFFNTKVAKQREEPLEFRDQRQKQSLLGRALRSLGEERRPSVKVF
jgi:hypothetical protein